MRRRVAPWALCAIVMTALMPSGCKPLGPNSNPVIVDFGGIRQLSAKSVAEYWCGAVDPDSDALGFVWSCTRGSFSDSGAIVHWTAPGSSGMDTMSVVVTDGRGGSATKSMTITVVPCTTMIAHWDGSLYAMCYTAISSKVDSGWCLCGHFSVDSALIDFLVMDAANYTKFTKGQAFEYLIRLDSVSDGSIADTIARSATYYLVLDNRRNGENRSVHVLFYKTSP